MAEQPERHEIVLKNRKVAVVESWPDGTVQFTVLSEEILARRAEELGLHRT